MTLAMSLDEQEAALRRAGVSKTAIAKWRADGDAVHLRGRPVTQPRFQDFPILLTVPWSALVSDNEKYAPVHTKGGNVKLILQENYREAKRKTRELAQQAMHGNVALRIPLTLTAEVWVPDNRRHDLCNFSKACFDALEKVVYADDSQLYEVHWIRRAVDCDHPRAELSISPCVPPEQRSQK